MAVHDVARIEEKLDRVKAGATLISDQMGGVLFQNMAEVLEFSKLMSLADVAVPKHLRGNPGACLRIVTQALEWRMSPFAVADQSYAVGDRISYQAQLVHAVVEQRAPLMGRLRHRFEGEGDERVCIVWGQVKGEVEPIEYRSPPFGKIQPKNSPLWKTKPDLQQYYNTSRDFCRAYFPDVLLGVYSEDEIRDSHIGPDKAKDITPKPDIAKRLAKKQGARGFDAAHVERETNPTTAVEGPAVTASESTPDARPAEPPPPASPSRAGAERTLEEHDMGHAGRPLPPHVPKSGFDSRDGSQSEIAGATEAPSGVEARAVPHQPPGESGPPSILQRYWDFINQEGIISPRDVARQSNKFFDKNTVDDEDRQPFLRLRTIRDNVLAGVYSRAEGEEKAQAVIRFKEAES